MDEKTIREEFEKIINQRGIGSDLGLTKHDISNLRKPERQNIKSMLYVLYLAGKLEIKDGSTTEEK